MLGPSSGSTLTPPAASAVTNSLRQAASDHCPMREPANRAYFERSSIQEALVVMAPRILFAATILLASVLPVYAADNPAVAPNSDPSYQQLRNLMLSGEAVSVSNFVLKRDAGRFHL